MLHDLVPLVVPIAFFWAITAVARTIAETRTRRRLIERNASPEVAAASHLESFSYSAPRDC